MKRRSESFLGIHFDFHALPGQAVPTCWQPDAFAEMLDAVQPDYVQCDTKGHAGLSSYPTKAGTQAAPMTQDILRMMRDETRKRGIALYGHHSGLYDQHAATTHPEWAVVDAEGRPSPDVCSVFGPFVDELLLPQLRELAGDYGLDGAWVDGECWALRVDYSPWALACYRERFGREAPRPHEEGYEAYREFCRQGFIDYVRHYVQTIQREFPDFQITSNWIYSSQMPEAMAFQPDFLSGDYATSNSVESARWEGRLLEARGCPWDLMAWGHHAIPCSWTTRNRNTKELAQYCQEAAVVVAMGGGFECFNILYGHGGTVQRWAIPIWRGMAAFCRQRQECFQARIRPELGIVFPAVRNDSEKESLYVGNPGAAAMRPWMQLLQDSQLSTKAIFEHELADKGALDRYQVIVLPNAATLPEAAIEGLKRFVENGGRLLVDAESVALLPSELTGLEANTAAPESRLLFVEGSGALAAAEVPFCEMTPLADGNGATPTGWAHDDNFFEAKRFPMAWQKDCGRGRVGVVAFSMQHFYAGNKCTAIRRFVKEQLDALGYRPLVTVTGSAFAEVTVTEKAGRLYVNLVNFAGSHNVEAVRGYDEVPAIGPLTVTIAAGQPVSAMRLVPDGTQLPFTRNPDGSTTAVLPRLEIHAAIVVEP